MGVSLDAAVQPACQPRNQFYKIFIQASSVYTDSL